MCVFYAEISAPFFTLSHSGPQGTLYLSSITCTDKFQRVIADRHLKCLGVDLVTQKSGELGGIILEEKLISGRVIFGNSAVERINNFVQMIEHIHSFPPHIL